MTGNVLERRRAEEREGPTSVLEQGLGINTGDLGCTSMFCGEVMLTSIGVELPALIFCDWVALPALAEALSAYVPVHAPGGIL